MRKCKCCQALRLNLNEKGFCKKCEMADMLTNIEVKDGHHELEGK